MHAGKNAFEGYVPSVPEGEKLDFGSKEFRELEEIGKSHYTIAAHCMCCTLALLGCLNTTRCSRDHDTQIDGTQHNTDMMQRLAMEGVTLSCF